MVKIEHQETPYILFDMSYYSTYMHSLLFESLCDQVKFVEFDLIRKHNTPSTWICCVIFILGTRPWAKMIRDFPTKQISEIWKLIIISSLSWLLLFHDFRAFLHDLLPCGKLNGSPLKMITNQELFLLQ